jgi:WhiB family transcriptional regulator, redox-sensing transcriptional regulator
VDLSWKASGACRWVDPELFYPVSESDAGPAKAVCARCEVRGECLEFALSTREWEGVWGGTTGTERRALVRRRRQPVSA